MRFLELLIALALSLCFLFAGLLSLRIIFVENFRRRVLKRMRREHFGNTLSEEKLTKSTAKTLIRVADGNLLAISVLVALIFLPIGLLMFIILIINAVASIF